MIFIMQQLSIIDAEDSLSYLPIYLSILFFHDNQPVVMILKSYHLIICLKSSCWKKRDISRRRGIFVAIITILDPLFSFPLPWGLHIGLVVVDSKMVILLTSP